MLSNAYKLKGTSYNIGRFFTQSGKKERSYGTTQRNKQHSEKAVLKYDMLHLRGTHFQLNNLIKVVQL